MKRRTVEVDHWRHFMPLAPDIELKVESGVVTYHSLPNDVIIQGARDPSTHESPSVDLSKIPFQRGWRLTFVPTTIPLQGHVEATVDGFKYFVHQQFNGEDCFNYLLTNGTQESNIGTVKLSVVQGYEYDITLEHKYNDTYEFNIVGLKPTELPIPNYQLFRWYWTYPKLVYNEVLDRKQVEWKRRLVQSYRIGGYYDNDYRYHYTVDSNPSKLSQSFPDDLALHDYPVGDTDQLYVATGHRGKIEIEVVFYFGDLMRSESRRIVVTPDALYGERWWESGNQLGQKPAEPQQTVASSTDLNSKDAIALLMDAVDSNTGATPNQFGRNLIYDAAKIIGVTQGEEMMQTLLLAAQADGDYSTIIETMLATNALSVLEDLQG